MNNGAVLPEEFIQILEAMPDAGHEALCSLTVIPSYRHTGIRPALAEIAVVSNKQDAVLIHNCDFVVGNQSTPSERNNDHASDCRG
mgnify:CR=1 FL=1